MIDAFDQDAVREFRGLYEEAVALGQEVFKFRGADVLVPYARYVVQYLEGRVQAD